MSDKMIRHNIASELSNDELLDICDGLYNGKYRTGVPSEDNPLKRIADESHIEISDLSEAILDEANRRFKNVFLLLINEEYFS